MASNDAHQGGDLFDMAKDGTSIPNDAGKMNLIPSKPRPGEGEDVVNANRSSLAGAATNATDISRSVKDIGAGGKSRLGPGHDRNDKHSKQKESDLERSAGEGPGVDRQPGEEGVPDEEMDKIIDSRERKQN
ncbi:hypothetical protein LOCC1_G001666 [Lachnellula occidentalis]|uniref:Uncharacterized protein n=1 Tax=Lachnellula occidentalis TaxID=215460 RepID=A0A8H8S7Y1_9HELO|nr:hypothetical protein LOCC1_G001666 [Lachnellula occidentalis]